MQIRIFKLFIYMYALMITVGKKKIINYIHIYNSL